MTFLPLLYTPKTIAQLNRIVHVSSAKTRRYRYGVKTMRAKARRHHIQFGIICGQVYVETYPEEWQI